MNSPQFFKGNNSVSHKRELSDNCANLLYSSRCANSLKTGDCLSGSWSMMQSKDCYEGGEGKLIFRIIPHTARVEFCNRISLKLNQGTSQFERSPEITMKTSKAANLSQSSPLRSPLFRAGGVSSSAPDMTAHYIMPSSSRSNSSVYYPPAYEKMYESKIMGANVSYESLGQQYSLPRQLVSHYHVQDHLIENDTQRQLCGPIKMEKHTSFQNRSSISGPTQISPRFVEYQDHAQSSFLCSLATLKYKFVRYTDLKSFCAANGGLHIAYYHIFLKFSFTEGYDVNLTPWSEFERLEGRRIIQVRRTQLGTCLHAQLNICREDLLVPDVKYDPDTIEVSCLRFLHHDMTEEFFVTSVDVLRIVELLLNNKEPDQRRRRKERARIRSNLKRFWKHDFADLKHEFEIENELQLAFKKRIQLYDYRNPVIIRRGVRLMSWNQLAPALRRALLYFRAIRDNYIPN